MAQKDFWVIPIALMRKRKPLAEFVRSTIDRSYNIVVTTDIDTFSRQ